MDDFIDFFVPILFLIGIIAILLWGIIAIHYHVNNVHLKVFVEERLVYDGRSACVDVSSAGYATSVGIYGGWYCSFPKEKYTAKDVRVETVLAGGGNEPRI